MRLSQLARRLSVKTSDIVDYLAQQHIPLEDRPNARVEPDHMVLAVKHFNAQLLEELLQADTEIVDEPTVLAPDQPRRMSESPPSESLVSDSPLAQVEGIDDVSDAPPEVIRAPKVELPGLRVVGKIDLPQPKKKDVAGESPEVRKAMARDRSATDRRQQKSPVALQREKEERERQRKKREEEKHLKKLRRERYLEKVKEKRRLRESKQPKPTAPTPSGKQPALPAPKTWIGKFFRWWTTP